MKLILVSIISNRMWYVPILTGWPPICWWRRIQGEFLIPLRRNRFVKHHTLRTCVSPVLPTFYVVTSPHGVVFYPPQMSCCIPLWIPFLFTCWCFVGYHCQTHHFWIDILHHFSWWNLFFLGLDGLHQWSQGPYAKHVAVEISTSMLGALRFKARLAARWKRRPQ